MDYVVVEGLPAVGKSETLALLERFYPENVRVFPELVKEVVERERLDLFRDRVALADALVAALPARRQRILETVGHGFLCLEESHLGVHRAYAIALRDAHFPAVYDPLLSSPPDPDLYVRLEIPVARSIERQAARGTPRFDIDAPTLDRVLVELDRWHADRRITPLCIDADRPAHGVVEQLTEVLQLPYGSPRRGLTETFDILFLLGRPASGKSEFIDFMAHLATAKRAEAFHIAPFDVLDDFPLLWQRFEEDDLWEGLGHPRLHSKRCDGNYAVTDDRLWGFLIEKVSRELDRRLAASDPLLHRTILVEFSRGGATGYADALRRFSPGVLDRAAILYISVPFEESWRRNIARYDEKRRDGILTHSVPREEMERTYGSDDWGSIAGRPRGRLEVNGISVPYATMDNTPESTDPAVLAARYVAALGPLHATWRAAR